MHPAQVRDAAKHLAAQGVNDCDIARRLGVPRTTIRPWRTRARDVEVCPRCWRTTKPVRFGGGDYAELLGLYLGDGHISPFARTERLRLHLDSRYPTIVDEAEALLRRCFPANRVGRSSRHDGSMVILRVYHGHLSCLSPQTGPGKKHLRPIALEPWQIVLVEAEPWRFLRGCIRTDGCVFVNRTGRYEYLSYEFSNLSQDTSSICSWPPATASAFDRDAIAAMCGSTGGTTSPVCSPKSVRSSDVDAIPSCLRMRLWRNW